MLRSIISFCVRERLIVLVATALIVAAGWYATQTVPIDAIPDVGENQVIVLTAWPGRSPKDIEDQVTYPLSVRLLAVPGAVNVRGKSMFGYSFVQVTFDDAVDFYWARSRVAEQLGSAAADLPEGLTPTLGPDATGLGQVLYYTLDAPPGMNLAELRSLQDYVVKYELQSVEGVSEVASVGGYVRQYQIEVAPDKLRFHDIPLNELIAALRQSNIDVGAKTVEKNGMEFIIRGKGFIGGDNDPQQAISDIEETVVRSRDGIPVRIRDLGYVQIGPEFRRGAIDLNGSEAVGGVVVMRYGENPRAVIENVQRKIDDLEPALNGVRLKLIYDRTELINETIATLTTALRDEIAITVIVVLLFLLHLRTSLVVAVTLPMAVLISFIAMQVFGIGANIMSLAGIAIAIGAVVDLGIVVSENIYRHLSEWEQQGELGGARQRTAIVIDATVEVAPAIMTAVTTTIISFLPIFFLTGRDYKLFSPLAWTKTSAMVAALLVSLLLIPLLCRLLLGSRRIARHFRILVSLLGGAVAAGLAALLWDDHLAGKTPLGYVEMLTLTGVVGLLCGYFISRERLRAIEHNPVSSIIHRVYEPTLRTFLRYKFEFLCLPTAIIATGLVAWLGLPRLMKPVEAVVKSAGGDLEKFPVYVGLKRRLTGLPDTDWIALDEGSWFYMPTLYPAASLSQAMQVLQTQDALIAQIPEVENVLGKIGRVESALDPAPAGMIETYVMLKPKDQWRPGETEQTIWQQINAVAKLPGITLASPLQPIEGRVVMLQSGIKASMAVRIYGDDLETLAKVSLDVADQLRQFPQVDASTVNPDIVLGKPYVEFDVDRKAAARFEMSAAMVNQVIEAALGGMNVTKTVEGRERYPIRIRYQRDVRERLDELRRLPVVTHTGEVVPLELLATMKTTWGPGMISSENARLIAHVTFTPSGTQGDLETASSVERLLREAAAKPPVDPDFLHLPHGYSIETVGSFENQVEANQRLLVIVPLVVLINLFLIYLQFRRLDVTLAVFAAIPVALAGGMIALGIGQVEMNTAVWVGFIALFGIAVDDGIIMATHLLQVYRSQPMNSVVNIRNATVEAGLKRIRPCLMTTATTIAALIPILIATGRGADVAQSMALPVFGGMVIELVTLFVVPILVCHHEERRLQKRLANMTSPLA